MFRFLPKFCLLLLLFIVFRANAQNPTITASGATTFCQGGSVVLKVTSDTTKKTFQWQKDGSNIQLGYSIAVNTGGSFRVISDSGSKKDTSVTITVSIIQNATDRKSVV